MPKSRSLPDYVLHITSYDAVSPYCRAFADGKLNLLILLGLPGVGKSWELRRQVSPNAAWLAGSVTAFGLYEQAFLHKDELIVIDDVDGLYSDRNCVRILKALCQTDVTKTVSWHSNCAALDKHGIPRSFTTSSQITIIGNAWNSQNENVAALEDRGHVLWFEPSPLEVHRRAATWFWNQEVFDFIASNLHLTKKPSFRTYVRADELFQAGLDWREAVLSRCIQGTALEVARLKSDSNYQTEKQRVQAFVAAGHGSRATYFNHSSKLKPTVEVPSISLINPRPQGLRRLHPGS